MDDFVMKTGIKNFVKAISRRLTVQKYKKVEVFALSNEKLKFLVDYSIDRYGFADSFGGSMCAYV